MVVLDEDLCPPPDVACPPPALRGAVADGERVAPGPAVGGGVGEDRASPAAALPASTTATATTMTATTTECRLTRDAERLGARGGTGRRGRAGPAARNAVMKRPVSVGVPKPGELPGSGSASVDGGSKKSSNTGSDPSPSGIPSASGVPASGALEICGRDGGPGPVRPPATPGTAGWGRPAVRPASFLDRGPRSGRGGPELDETSRRSPGSRACRRATAGADGGRRSGRASGTAPTVGVTSRVTGGGVALGGAPGSPSSG